MRTQIGGYSQGVKSAPDFTRTQGTPLISTCTLLISASPTFSTECGGNGSSHIGVVRVGASEVVRVTSNTLPRGSRQTKSLQLDKDKTAGQRCVCTGTICPGKIRVRRTRTCSFSNRRLWWSGAAVRASRESGHGQRERGVRGRGRRFAVGIVALG